MEQFLMNSMKKNQIRLLSGRQRGVTLTEAILYLIIAASSIVLVAGLIYNEQQRQSDIVTGNVKRILLEQSQTFVAVEYDDIRRELVDTTPAVDDPLAIRYSMQDLANRGYLPQSFLENGTITNRFGQEYFLFVRAVNRDDAAIPKATLTTTAIGGPGFDFDDPSNEWLDPTPGVGGNRFDLEAVLISVAGDRIPPNRGNRVASSTGIATSGYVQAFAPPTLSGSFNSYQLNLQPFDDIFQEDIFPDLTSLSGEEWIGSVGGIVALSGFNDVAVSTGGGDTVIVNQDGENNFIFRCADPDDTTGTHPDQPFTYDYDVCINDSTAEVYQNIVFNSGNLNAAIENVSRIIMSGDDREITNVSDIQMGDDGTIGGTNLTVNLDDGELQNARLIVMNPGGTINMSGGPITNVSSLGFELGCGLSQTAANTLNIDCDTEIAGTLLVEEDTFLQENLRVGENIRIDGTTIDFDSEDVTLTADAGALTVEDRLRVGDTSGFDGDTLASSSITTESDIFVGDAPRDQSFAANNPGVALLADGDGDGRGLVEADDFVIRGINPASGGFALTETIVNAIDLRPNTSDVANRLTLPSCDGQGIGEPQVYVTVNAVSSENIINDPSSAGLPASASVSDGGLNPAPLSDHSRYQNRPLLGYRYVALETIADTEVRFFLIARFENLGEPEDPDPATNPVVEVYLDATTQEMNRIAAFVRCAPPV